MYIAVNHIRVKGRVVPAGEILPPDTPADLINRLLGLGAVRDAAPGQPVPEKVLEPVPEEAAEDVEVAEDEEIVPEIDVTDGVVAAPRKKKKGRAGK